MQKNILFINCPINWAVLPPLGISLLLSFLSKKGLNPFFYDLNLKIYNKLDIKFKKNWTINREYITKEFFYFCFENFKFYFNEIIEIIKKNNIEFIGFNFLNSNKNFVLELSNWIKYNIPDIKIILGGPETFSFYIQNKLELLSFIDFIVVGEGEIPLLKIFNNNSENKLFLFEELDYLSINYYPDYKNINLYDYPKKNTIPLIFSRGCYKKCKFCSEKFLFKNYRIRDPENVIEEIIYHYKNNNITHFIFYDSMFNSNLEKLEKLLDLIIHNNLKITWEAQIGVRNDMPMELLNKFKKSGCINLFIGIESGSDEILFKMNKGFNSNDAKNFLEKLYNSDLNYEISLIVNYPEETEKNFNETLNFIKNNKNIIKKIAQISLFKNYPGTNIILPENYDESLGLSKIEKLISLLENEKIKYTKSYINNLI